MLRLSAIDKSFGATLAVRDVTLEAAPGSVLGLVGENGAGKSTLMKIAGGLIAPDKGIVSLDGAAVSGLDARQILERGIASVFQELTLVRSLTVAENICLLAPPTRPWRSIDRRRLETECRAVLVRYQVTAPPNALVGNLPLGLQQMLEIVRAVRREPKVLLLDEATAALGSTEVKWLASIVAAERARGTVVLFISHRWDEIVAFCQRVAIMRNGQLIDVSDVADLSHDAAVERMTGRRLGATFPPRRMPAEELLLEARGLESPALREVSLTVARGEILGLGGLVGQGQDELLRSLFGAHPLRQGTIVIGGRPCRLRRPSDAIRQRVAYVPQERKIEGLLLHKSVGTNTSLVILRRLSRVFGLIDWRTERTIVRDAISRLRIRTASAAEPVGTLSGGNQQKVLLQKWLLIEPDIVLLNDVTRGVDIATKVQIYEIIAGLAAKGLGIILYSTDAHELVELAHRVVVMVEGSIRTELHGHELTADSIIGAALGTGAIRSATLA
jgi:ribose transport system ATP-binding protein